MMVLLLYLLLVCVQGAVSNIFLDWLFIFPLQMGVVGAAIASGLGQIFSLLVLLSHFIRKHGNLRIRRFSLQPVLIKKICKCGAPESVTQLTTPVTALCYNLVLASLIGDIGVSTYNVLSFIYSLANAILSGVAQGLQPLWGNSYGKQDTKEINEYFHVGMAVNLVLSILVSAGLIFFDESIIHIPGSCPKAIPPCSTLGQEMLASSMSISYPDSRSTTSR